MNRKTRASHAASVACRFACAAALAAGAVALSAGPAAAESSPPSVESSAPSVYPPSQPCALLGQPSAVVPGATIQLTGADVSAGVTVIAQLQPAGTTIGSSTADSTGAYTVSATIPAGVSGPATVTINNQTCATLAAVPGTPPTTPASTPPTTPLPSTPVISFTATPMDSASTGAASASPIADGVPSTSASGDGILATTVKAPPSSSTPALAKAGSGSSSPLAFTGASIMVPSVLAILLIGGGLAFVWVGRRARHREG